MVSIVWRFRDEFYCAYLPRPIAYLLCNKQDRIIWNLLRRKTRSVGIGLVQGWINDISLRSVRLEPVDLKLISSATKLIRLHLRECIFDIYTLSCIAPVKQGILSIYHCDTGIHATADKLADAIIANQACVFDIVCEDAESGIWKQAAYLAVKHFGCKNVRVNDLNFFYGEKGVVCWDEKELRHRSIDSVLNTV
jgi:hypothetical protein